ncbi:MAG: hypothetical protein WD042_04795 [Phycisphaeraceae bacterium]
MTTDSAGYVYHIISNTHWDREWTHTFQRNRMLLVDVLTKTMRRGKGVGSL